MKKIILICLTVVALSSCSDRIDVSGNVITVERAVDGFKGIKVSSGINTTVTMGDETWLEITADDNIISYIETFVDDEILTIRVKDNTSFRGNLTLRAAVGAIELSDCSAYGGASIKLANQLSAQAVRVDLSGGSRYSGPIVTDQLSVGLSGGSVMETTGTASRLNLDCSGGSIFGDFNFVTNEVNASLSGGSRSTLTVNESLKVSASGGSTFRYRGTPSIIDRNASGGSTIESAN